MLWMSGCGSSLPPDFAAAPDRVRPAGPSARPPREPSAARPSRGGAVLACAVLLTGLSATGSAYAQTTNADGSKTIWSTTMTVGTNVFTSGAVVNEHAGYSDPAGFGSLGSTQIPYGGTNYSISFMAWTRTFSSGTLQGDIFNVTLSAAFPATAGRKLVLELDGTRFPLADAVRSAVGYTWNDHGLNWANNDSVAVKLIELQPPSAPRSLRAKGYSATEILLSWSAPEKKGGSAITGYKIEVSTDGVSNWSTLAADTSSTDTTYSHTGLRLGAKRYYRVSAINAVGTGPVSSTASAIAEPDGGRIPGNVRAKGVSMTQIDLSWSRPTTRRYSITGYRIEVSRDG